jgi:DNA anti-recombination protein RmuC
VSGRRLLVLAVACLAGVGVARAADAPQARDKARTYLILRVVDALNLSDEKALEMRGILRRAEERRLELEQKRDALEASLRETLRQPTHDDATLTRLVTDAHAVQRELAELPEHTFGEAQKVLTVEQQAKLLLFRRELQAEVRQALQRRRTTPPAAVAATPPSPPPTHARTH